MNCELKDLGLFIFRLRQAIDCACRIQIFLHLLRRGFDKKGINRFRRKLSFAAQTINNAIFIAGDWLSDKEDGLFEPSQIKGKCVGAKNKNDLKSRFCR